MGANLVRRATAIHLCDLRTHAARVVLLVMATTAKDSDTDPVYFAGDATLAAALGYSDPTSKTAQRAVNRAMTELESLGLVTTSDHHPRHHKRRRLLHIAGPVDAAVHNLPASAALPDTHVG